MESDFLCLCCFGDVFLGDRCCFLVVGETFVRDACDLDFFEGFLGLLTVCLGLDLLPALLLLVVSAVRCTGMGSMSISMEDEDEDQSPSVPMDVCECP